MKVDSVFVTVPISNEGRINFSNVVNAYNSLNESLDDIYLQVSGDNKRIQLVDISIQENKTKAYSETIKLTTFITRNPPRLLEPFYPWDYWKPMYEVGQCGDYEGQGIGCDGGKMIADHAANAIIRPFEGYFTDIIIQQYSAWEEEEYLWSAYGNLNNECFSPTELQYWTNKLIQLGWNNTPSGKKIIGYQLEGTIIPGGVKSDSSYGYLAYITYGKWHSSVEEEF